MFYNTKLTVLINQIFITNLFLIRLTTNKNLPIKFRFYKLDIYLKSQANTLKYLIKK